MASLKILLFLCCWTSALTLPHHAFDSILKRSRVDFESSGSGPDEPVRGIVKVVQLNPLSLPHSSFFRRELTPRRAPSLGSRLSFPAFLASGRPSQTSARKTPVSPLHHLNPKNDVEPKKRQGQQMWQRAISKGEKMHLPVNLKDTKQTCSAVPFTQHVTAEGCSTVMVHNKLCFGQCSSLFVPSEGEFTGPGATGTGSLHHRAPCSRCAPSKSHTVTVPLRCGAEVRERRLVVVEECKCETGREEKSASEHL